MEQFRATSWTVNYERSIKPRNKAVLHPTSKTTTNKVNEIQAKCKKCAEKHKKYVYVPRKKIREEETNTA